MIVRRITEYSVENFHVGDQISVGKYTATAVNRVDDNTMLFCLDQYLDGPFTHEDLLDRLNEYLQTDPNFNTIMPDVAEIDGVKFRVPYVGEMFGENDLYESDKDDGTWEDQWELMKHRPNRIAEREGEKYEWGWLMNHVKGYASGFALVYFYGYPYYTNASYSYGVRPVFALKEKSEESIKVNSCRVGVMTREELREHCKKEIEMCEFWAHSKVEELNNNKIYQEHKLILELLEQEPCEDAVSRTELKKWLDMNFSFGGALRKLEMFDRLDKELPSVTPQPKIGHWLYDDDHSSWSNLKYKCSCCKREIIVRYEARDDVYKDYPYCHCGAKMRVE